MQPVTPCPGEPAASAFPAPLLPEPLQQVRSNASSAMERIACYSGVWLPAQTDAFKNK